MSILCTADFDYTLSGVTVERKSHSNYNSHIGISHIIPSSNGPGYMGRGKMNDTALIYLRYACRMRQ
jgi:hypothetical protein